MDKIHLLRMMKYQANYQLDKLFKGLYRKVVNFLSSFIGNHNLSNY